METTGKKISQSELRKFMTAHKRKASENVKKIESPLAKYSENGELMCIVCNTIVKSEAVWSVHINSKKHKDIIKKSQTSTTSDIPTSWPTEKIKSIPKKPDSSFVKPKSILKNGTPLPPKFFDTIKTDEDEEVPKKKPKFDIDVEGKSDMDIDGIDVTKDDEVSEADSKDKELPEGFFDDPIMDAKARNVEYKDPVEEEWERFQKEIKEETDLSARMINDDTEDATTQRHIEQFDEQMSRLTKVFQLEVKKEEVKAKILNRMEVVTKEEPESDDSDLSDLEGEFDWRAKRYLC